MRPSDTYKKIEPSSDSKAELSENPAPTNTSLTYTIGGGDMPYVEFTLAPGTSAIAEPGAMMSMDDGVNMNTVLGDGSESSWGIIGRFLRALKRPFTGESLFSVIYDNPTNMPKKVSFAAPYPGTIMPVNLGAIGGKIICQRGAFLCGIKGVRLGVAMQKRLRVGFFGGEGFVMQKLEGDNIVFINAGGSLTERVLTPGETLRVDTGCLAALQPNVNFSIKYAGRLKNAFFGGEGLFFASVTGPGSVWLQSMPVKRLSAAIMANASVPQGGRGKWGRAYFFFAIIFIVYIFFIEVPAPTP